MKISVKVFGVDGKPDTPAIPQELFRQIQSIQQLLVVPMRTFGISTIQLNILPTLPVSDVQVSTKDMDKTLIPKALLDRRRGVLRGIKELMLVYGLNEISIALSDKEWDELKAYWVYLASGNSEALDNEHFKDVPLRYEVDPATEPIAVQQTLEQAKAIAANDQSKQQ